jgi:hypothetical protein
VFVFGLALGLGAGVAIMRAPGEGLTGTATPSTGKVPAAPRI